MDLDTDNKLKLDVRNSTGAAAVVIASSQGTIVANTWYFAAYKW